VVDVMDDARRGAVQANKTKAAEDFFGGKAFCQLLFVAQTIL